MQMDAPMPIEGAQSLFVLSTWAWTNERQMSGYNLCLGFFVWLTDTRKNLLSVLDEEHVGRLSLKVGYWGLEVVGSVWYICGLSLFQGVLASRASSRAPQSRRNLSAGLPQLHKMTQRLSRGSAALFLLLPFPFVTVAACCHHALLVSYTIVIKRHSSLPSDEFVTDDSRVMRNI